jgi:hypothetical protein
MIRCKYVCGRAWGHLARPPFQAVPSAIRCRSKRLAVSKDLVAAVDCVPPRALRLCVMQLRLISGRSHAEEQRLRWQTPGRFVIVTGRVKQRATGHRSTNTTLSSNRFWSATIHRRCCVPAANPPRSLGCRFTRPTFNLASARQSTRPTPSSTEPGFGHTQTLQHPRRPV